LHCCEYGSSVKNENFRQNLPRPLTLLLPAVLIFLWSLLYWGSFTPKSLIIPPSLEKKKIATNGWDG